MSATPALALGLMSGTSLDGIDAALIRTDGATVSAFGPSLTAPYDPALRERLRGVLGGNGPVAEVEREITLGHVAVVERLLTEHAIAASEVRIIGFHGHTILHRPEHGRTWQIGDGALLARETGIDVVCDFRSADVAAGGQGAPFAPLYHRALCAGMPRPVAVLNIGGVANVTWIGPGEEVLAFDTGPGNALIDDWTRRHTGRSYDAGGGLAATGRVDEAIVALWLSHPYFGRSPPKSLDRDDFDTGPVSGLSPEDGAATLAAMTCAAVARALDHVSAPPLRWLVTGGGRRNAVLMRFLRERLGARVDPVETVGWDGDSLEAQAFAFLAVRSLAGMPLSEPGTTGVRAPISGGRLYGAAR